MEMVSKKKKTSVTSMTQGNPMGLLLAFALPLMAGNVFQQLYTVVDTAIVGQALGVNALAALGAVDWLNWMVLGIIQGIAQGFSILISQWFGAEDYEKMRKSAGNSITMAVISAAVILIIAQLLVGPVMNLLHTPEEIMPIGESYIRVLFAGIPIVMAYNMASSILRALGDSATPLRAMIVASITNIVLDILFVIGFGWGVEGAAVATVLAQLLSAVYCFAVIRKLDELKLSREDFRLESSFCQKLMVLAAPMAFQNTIIAVGGMIVQMVVNGMGVAFIAGMTATNKLYGLLEIAATSYGYSMTTYAGQNLGAGDGRRISQGVRAGLIIGTVTSLIIAAVMLVFGKGILGLFISAGEASSGQAMEIAYRYLSYMSVCLPILYVLHIVRSCLQGMGNTVIPMVSGISEFVMRTLSSLILPVLFGQNGIMYAEIIAWIGADLVLVPGYFKVKKSLEKRQILRS